MPDEFVLFDRASQPMRPELIDRLTELNTALRTDTDGATDVPGDDRASVEPIYGHRRSRRRRHTWLILAAALVFAVTSVALFSRTSDIEGEVMASIVEPGSGDSGQESNGSATTFGEPIGESCGEGVSSVVDLDAASGRDRWTLCANGQETLRVLASDELSVFAASTSSSGDASVVVIGAATGAERFRIDITSTNESDHIDALDARGPLSGDGVIVLTIRRGDGVFVVGYDSSTGVQLWSTPAEGVVVANTERAVVVAHPVDIVDQVATVRSFIARDRRTGRPMWTVEAAAGLGVAFVDDELLVLSDTTVDRSQPSIAIDMASGGVVWESDSIGGSVIRVGPVLVGLVVDATGEATVHAVDPLTGRGLWSVADDASGLGGPVAGVDAVYVSNSSALSALDAETGEAIWSIDIRAKPGGATPGAVVVTVGDVIQRRDDSDGDVIWSAAFGDAARVSVVVTARAVYVSQS